MSKTIELLGLGNAITDVVVEISDELHEKFGFVKGTMTLVDVTTQESVLSQCEPAEKLMSGGSVANSIIAFSQLGGKGGFIGRLGADDFGKHYKEEFDNLGILFSGDLNPGSVSGTCVSLVTPDSERTMITALGASAELGDEDVHEEAIAKSEWCFVEGYVIGNPDRGHGAVARAVELCKKSSTKIAVTFSAPFIIEVFRTQLEQVVKSAELVFANEEEGPLYVGCDTPEQARDKLMELVPHVVVTAGAQGCYIGVSGEKHHVPAFSCDPVDLTGAGDMFAGAYLYGINNGMPVNDAGRMANFLASQVITQYGARLMSDPAGLWASEMSNS